jgi:hypothetical protein
MVEEVLKGEGKMKVIPKQIKANIKQDQYDNYSQHDKRFVIIDDSGNIVDDAQGWGYKTEEKARKAMWYKFKGGKKKIDKREEEKRVFFDNHQGLDKFLHRIWENNFKEIARGEVTEQDIIDDVKKEFGIDLPKEYVQGIG